MWVECVGQASDTGSSVQGSGAAAVQGLGWVVVGTATCTPGALFSLAWRPGAGAVPGGAGLWDRARSTRKPAAPA